MPVSTLTSIVAIAVKSFAIPNLGKTIEWIRPGSCTTN